MSWFRSPIVSFATLALVSCGTEAETVDPLDVHVVDRGSAYLAGATVYGHASTGQRVAEAITDSLGHATVHVPAGGSITVHSVVADADPSLEEHHWYTVYSVEPGDDLLVRLARGDERLVPMQVTAPALPSGATHFVVDGGCGEAQGTTTATLLADHDNCGRTGTLVLTAVDDTVNPLGFIIVRDAELAGDLSVEGPWGSPQRSFEARWGGFDPDGVFDVSHGSLLDDLVVHWSHVTIDTTASIVSATGFVPEIDQRSVYRVSQTTGTPCDTRNRTLIATNDALEAVPYMFTFRPEELMRRIDDLRFDDHELRWTGGELGMGIFAGVVVTERSGEVLGRRHRWDVLSPAGPSQIRFPRDIEFPWPGAQTSGEVITSAYVRQMDWGDWSTYAEVRQHHADNQKRIPRRYSSTWTSLAREYVVDGCPPAP